MEQPNLAMIPSGVKAGKLYSIMPENGVGDFSATRNSTATRVNKDGLIETVAQYTPRLNYDLINGKPDSCPHYLLEPQVTNMLPRSEDFDTGWIKNGASINTNQIISPDGSLSAYELVEDSANSTHNIYDVAGTIGNVETLSVFAKKNTRSFIALQGGNSSCYYGLGDGTVSTETNSTGKIEDFGNGWFRCSMTFTRASNTNNYIYAAISQSQAFYQGDGSSSVYIWGAQLEQSLYSTSYIPTSGTTVTRAADSANNAGDASTFNSEEGILYAEIQALANDGTNRIIALSDGTGSNLVRFYFSNSSNRIVAQIKNGGSTQATFDIAGITVQNFNKVAVKYKANDFAIWINGTQRDTDISGSTPTGLSELAFDDGAGSSDFYGKTKDIRYYDTEGMTDTEINNLLTQLTQ